MYGDEGRHYVGETYFMEMMEDIMYGDGIGELHPPRSS